MNPLACRSLAFLLTLSGGALAQSVPLEFDVDGGSVPGTIEWSLGPGQPFQQAGLILLSVSRGPTPLARFDPLDPRQLDVGTESLSLTQGGVFPASGRVVPPSVAVPNLTHLIDRALFLQGVSLPGSPRLIDRISEPRVIRFGPAGTWRDRLVSFRSARSFFPVLDAGGGRVLLAGGGSGGIFAQVAQKTTQLYEPLTDAFTDGPDMTVERSLHSATRLADGRWLLVGGVDGNNDPQPTAEIWDPVAGTFTATPQLALQRAAHSATLLPDGRVLVAGGITDLNAPVTPIDPVYSATATTEIYDPASDTWSAGPAMNRPRIGHMALTRSDGSVLLFGGVSWRRVVIRVPTIETSSDVYDPATGQVSAGPTMANARADASVVALGGGRWLIAGGVATISLTQWGSPTASAEIYDENTGSFTATGTMAAPRALHAAYRYGPGRYIHIGGGDGTLFALTPHATCEIYDVASGTWSAGPSLTQARAAFGHYRTPTGQVHVLGGSNASGGVDNTSEFLFR